MALAFLSVAQLVLVGLTRDRRYADRSDGRGADLEQLTTLASRVEMAEAIAAREQERMHELRATVSSVALSHRLLSDRKTTLSCTARWRLERLREAELARIERILADTPREAVGPVDLAGVLDPLVDAVRLRGHAVLWKGTRCQALGRSDDIAEIAHILLDNAGRHGSGRQIELAVSDRGGQIELCVSDCGPGVPPTLAPVVFERGTRSSTSRGEGIGLHIARRLAADLGGDLRLESVPATSGAVFVLQLEPTGGVPCLAPAV